VRSRRGNRALPARGEPAKHAEDVADVDVEEGDDEEEDIPGVGGLTRDA
jgi:hypothetical protein